MEASPGTPVLRGAPMTLCSHLESLFAEDPTMALRSCSW